MKVTAQAQRSGDWWAVEVPEVDGVFTQAKRLDQVAEMVADAVGLLEEIDPATIEVHVSVAVPDAVRAGLAKARDHREQAEALNVEASSLVRQVALDLVGLGYSMRDIGVVIGVSHQRVAQLLAPRPMTIKEAGEAATRGINRTSSKAAKSTKNVHSIHGHSHAKSVSRKSKSAAAAAVAQSPRRVDRSAAARASRQPKA